jgi:cytidylate kinase
MDGRDIGTVVLPRAQVKIFLTASAEERAKRRFLELQAKGKKDTYEQVLKELQKRDYQDTHREIAPLKRAKDAVVVDTSELDIDGVVAAIRQIVQEKCGV